MKVSVDVKPKETSLIWMVDGLETRWMRRSVGILGIFRSPALSILFRPSAPKGVSSVSGKNFMTIPPLGMASSSGG